MTFRTKEECFQRRLPHFFSTAVVENEGDDEETPVNANGMTAPRKEENRQVAIHPKEAYGQANEFKQSLNAKSLGPDSRSAPVSNCIRRSCQCSAFMSTAW